MRSPIIMIVERETEDGWAQIVVDYRDVVD